MNVNAGLEDLPSSSDLRAACQLAPDESTGSDDPQVDSPGPFHPPPSLVSTADILLIFYSSFSAPRRSPKPLASSSRATDSSDGSRPKSLSMSVSAVSWSRSWATSSMCSRTTRLRVLPTRSTLSLPSPDPTTVSALSSPDARARSLTTGLHSLWIRDIVDLQHHHDARLAPTHLSPRAPVDPTHPRSHPHPPLPRRRPTCLRSQGPDRLLPRRHGRGIRETHGR